MAGAREAFRASSGIDRSQDGLRTIVRRDSGGYTPSSCIDRDRKRCAMVRGIVGHHWSQFQLVKPLAAHCETDQTPRVGSHKIDHFRSDHLCRDHEVAFILTILIIRNHDHAPCSQLPNSPWCKSGYLKQKML